MKIRSINISEFGGLKDFSLDFSESLNIINGENESGKSTVLLFIVYMLYGLSRKGPTAAVDKARSVSWENSRAQGYMDIELDGKVYRLTRSLKGKGTTTSVFSVYALDTGEEVACSEPSELFLGGVSRETFESCCLCGQLRNTGVHGEQVASTLSNLSLGADESVNAAEVLDTVRKARKEYRYEKGKGGLIDSVSDQIEALTIQKLRAEGELALLRHAKTELEAKKELHQKAKKRLYKTETQKESLALFKKLSKFEEHRKTQKDLSDAITEREELLKASGFEAVRPTALELAELRHLSFEHEKKRNSLSLIENTPKNERARIDIKAKEAADRINVLGGKDAYLKKVRCEKKKRSTLKAAAFVCAAASFVSFLLCMLSIIFLAVGVLFLAGTALCFVLAAKRADSTDTEEYVEFCFAQLEIYNAQRTADEQTELSLNTARTALQEVESIIRQKLVCFGRISEGSPSEALDMLVRDITRYLEADSALAQRISVLQELEARQASELSKLNEAELRASLPQEPHSFPSEEDIEIEYRSAQAEEKRLLAELTELRIKTEAGVANEQKLYDIEKELDELEEKRKDYVEKYEIYDIAFRALEQAKDNLQKTFAPEVRKKAGKLLERISGGRYSTVFLSEKMEVSVDKDGAPRAPQTLSVGTADVLYLALRMALIDCIFGGKAPLFLDETLAQVDDKRAVSILRLIDDFSSQGNQCLLFSCHNRENALCDMHGIPYHAITMNR